MEKVLFGTNVTAAVADKFEGLLADHEEEIDSVLKRDRNLPITVKVVLKAVGAKVEYKVSTNFVKSRSKDKASGVACEEEEEGLFDEKGKVKYNIIPIKAPLTRPEDWFSSLDWLVGYGKDEDRYKQIPAPLHVNHAYAVLNRMRDAWEERDEYIAGWIKEAKQFDERDYRREMYEDEPVLIEDDLAELAG